MADGLGAPTALTDWLDVLGSAVLEAEDASGASSPGAAVLPSYMAFAVRIEETRQLTAGALALAHHGPGPDSALVLGWSSRSTLAALAQDPALDSSRSSPQLLKHTLLSGLPLSDQLWEMLRAHGEDALAAAPLRLRVSWEHSGAGAPQVRVETSPMDAKSIEAVSSGNQVAREKWTEHRALAWAEKLRGTNPRELRDAAGEHGARHLGGVRPKPAERSAAEVSSEKEDEIRLWFDVEANEAPVSSLPAHIERRLDPETDPYWREICATSTTGFTATKPTGCSTWVTNAATYWCGPTFNPNCNFCDSNSAIAGYYYWSIFQSVCQCPAGQYSAAGAVDGCTSCPSGYYSADGASSCTACAAGKYTDNGISCSTCLAGYESASGAGSCSSCSAGQYSQGGTSPVPSCSDCTAGKYQIYAASSFCVNCPSGYYCAAGTADYSSTPCSAGKYSLASASSCDNCPGGSYSAASGAGFCSTCGSGQYSSLSAGSTGCTACSTGTYQVSQGQTSCSSCSAGTYTSSTGAVSCSDCAAGKYQTDTGSSSCNSCAAGSYSSAAATSCSACPTGNLTLTRALPLTFF